MPLPNDFNTVTVYGSYVGVDGVAASGTITFTARYRLRSAATKIVILPGAVVATLDINGSFTTELPATDDPDIAPDGWAWSVTERFGSYTRTYLMLAPLGGSIDLTNVQPAEPPVPAPVNSIITVVGKGANSEGDVPIVLNDLSDTVITTPASGQVLRHNGTAWINSTSLAGTGDMLSTNNLADVASVSNARTNLGLGGAAVLAVGTVAGTVAAADDTRIVGAAQASNNLLDLWDAPTARTNLGLSSTATKNVGTTAGTVAAGDDARLSDARTPVTHVHLESDITALTADLAAKAPLASPSFTGTVTATGNAQVTGTLLLSAGAAIDFGGASDTHLYRSGANALATDGDFTVWGTLHSAQLGSRGAPTSTAGANAGTGATSSVTGTDTAGTWTLTTGTGTAAGQVGSVNFSAALPAAPRISITAKNSATATLAAAGLFAVATTTSIQLNVIGTPPVSTALVFDWIALP